ncbi:AAA-domain-containing protein [Mytilinidion resinicola]|uniref:AAA-domain-containing protein n=1 Tax=Mytilinidion resinicola TaxID=574789 RepID=A0A6A6Z1K7_9PEZI|nr:AAA-domain-containing protein [Mytilinidion resinicola]KAF2814880.1 AAA-domain-containing protein [Mytilinidion resinicola]
MMRSNPSSAMQKTYDECFLTCSTAVYFESQNNEAEALRSWRDALDQIYYHNAYRVPATYRPRSETEKALQDSLHSLELQCKERVDLLEALKRSREEAKRAEDDPSASSSLPSAPANPFSDTLRAPGAPESERSGWLGGGTIPVVGYTDLSRPPLPQRPSIQPRKSSGTEQSRSKAIPPGLRGPSPARLSPAPAMTKKAARTPSPEKKGGMLRTLRPGKKDGERAQSSSKMPSSMRSKPPAAAKAATQAWGSNSRLSAGQLYSQREPSKESISAANDSSNRSSFERRSSRDDTDRSTSRTTSNNTEPGPSPFYFKYNEPPSIAEASAHTRAQHTPLPVSMPQEPQRSPRSRRDAPPTPPPHKYHAKSSQNQPNEARTPQRQGANMLSYRNEYPKAEGKSRKLANTAASRVRTGRGPNGSPVMLEDEFSIGPSKAAPHRKGIHSRSARSPLDTDSESGDDAMNSGIEDLSLRPNRQRRSRADTIRADLPPTPTSQESEDEKESRVESDQWKEKVDHLMKNLPKGVDEAAAKQIFNEIVIQGDEVHWDDVAGLDIAKSALKETVVYPFLRPDLFMGLREPARGMLLFGPPGTGKTMLARAVATESKSTFFAISASSLTSKFLGESEKLVRALFQLAKALAPSIIFVDEIDSLLSSRSGGEHEATRRIKTEFLIQWSDLAKAAAGREQSERDRERGDASRVLVLAATNLPWAIDEAARRRFVRRQYIPLPEDHVRKTQLSTLLSHQKHELTDRDLDALIELTDGFSGSDITALAKDAAMGPLRSLGEKLLHMTMDEIRPIQFEDFVASLSTIRPSVSKEGLKQFDEWAREFGERGG